MIVEEINMLTNYKLQKRMQYLSIPLFLVLFILFWSISNVQAPSRLLISHNFNEVILSIILFFSIFVLHEVTHAIFFKMFCPSSRIKFGFKKGMIYTESIGSIYSIREFITSCIAPFILVTMVLFVLSSLNILSGNLFILIATLHGISCVGDFYWIYVLRKKYGKSKFKVVPTEEGILVVS